MRVGYGINRSDRDFAKADVARLYIDTDRTERMERADLLQYGLRRGDTLVLLAAGDLGRGAELPAIRRILEERGVTTEIVQTKPKRQPGRPPEFAPNDEQDRLIRGLWYSLGVFQMGHVLRRAEEIFGSPVSRNQLDHRYGPRDGSMPEGRGGRFKKNTGEG